MIDTSKHIRLGAGLTVEVLTGVVLLFRSHGSEDKIPGTIKETFVAFQPDGRKYEFVEDYNETSRMLLHCDAEGVKEFKAYIGKMGTLEQRRVVREFLKYLNLGGVIVQRAKNVEGEE